MTALWQALSSWVLIWAYIGGPAPPSPGAGQLSAAIEGGSFEPTYPAADGKKNALVRAFRLDRTPVTNADFLSFVQQNPSWSRERISALFAERGYLSHWAGPGELGPGAPPRAPVVNVSWFAANAYCKARGARLPTELEWEYAAAASESARDARRDPAFNARILSWYSKPSAQLLANVASGAPNAWGVYDLHGLVWEWVVDFNSTLVSSDSRDLEKESFCGAGASSARDVGDYAAFMRVALLSSLTGRDSTRALGFRCASDQQEGS